MAKSKSGPHGQAHPVNWLAAELGVDRVGLARLLGSGEFTTRQAFEALSGKQEKDKDRTRRQKAEADTAEIEAAEKRGMLMLTENHLRWVRELGTQTRLKIMDASHISEDSKKRLCQAVDSIRVEK